MTRAVDLAELQEELLRYFATVEMPGEPFGCFRSGPEAAPDFYSSLDIALCRVVMGEDLRSSLSPARRASWAQWIAGQADPTDGSFPTYSHHSKLHSYGMVVGALGALGGRLPYPVRLHDHLAEPAQVPGWLEGIDWAAQWTASHEFWGGMHCFSLSKRCTPEWLDAVFAWLDAELDPQSGWWRRGVPHQDRHQALGGAAHILPIYQHHDRAFPYPEALAERLLTMQLPNGRWILGPSDRQPATYLELDALYALQFVREQAPGHREDQIQAAVRRYADFLLGQWEHLAHGLTHAHPHWTLAGLGTLGLLQAFRPEAFPNGGDWSDIFTCRRLYDVAAIE